MRKSRFKQTRFGIRPALSKHLLFSGFFLYAAACSVGGSQSGNSASVKPAYSSSDSIESALLQPSPGYVGNKLGLTVEQVTTDPDSGVKTLTITVPEDVGEIHSVEVLDAGNQPIPVPREAKILRDYENNNVGLKVYLAPKSNLQFKLKLSTEQ